MWTLLLLVAAPWMVGGEIVVAPDLVTLNNGTTLKVTVHGLSRGMEVEFGTYVRSVPLVWKACSSNRRKGTVLATLGP